MENEKSVYRKGLQEIILCMVLWGVLPIYWKSLVPINSWIIIIYRVLLVFLVALIFALRKYSMKEIFAPVRTLRGAGKFLAAGIIITLNWSVFIWAVNSGHILQSSIGYYIEPMAVALLGVLIFHEKLTKYKVTALLFALAAVIIMLVHYGELPTIALLIAISFAVYSAIKKSISEPPAISLVCETFFLAPIALVVILFLEFTGRGALGQGQPYQYGLLMLCGLVTVIPLTLFAGAAQKVQMFTLGVAEYISPTLNLLIGVFIYHEPLDRVQFIALVIIWIGLCFFTAGEFRSYKGMDDDIYS
ncbi:MAG: EamA family transporter RarD [Mobilibacterium timonense]|uniref:EamA family transporter RarD n=1 Tax=Mobilibacterium timonense TaxID=1871012 RepID=UPI0009841883|nr:EamA family transporter RarD [Mobilibacterium timonense]MBM6991338.1 EamA family transporter RarD [Mobilibacterium timonense]